MCCWTQTSNNIVLLRHLRWIVLSVGEWLQVDLESNRRIFGVATQGQRVNSNYVTTYVITYKRDGQQSFETYTDDKGNAKVSRFIRVVITCDSFSMKSEILKVNLKLNISVSRIC